MKNVPNFHGIKFLRDVSPKEKENIDLGPLRQLEGTWTSPESAAQGWNVIAVPGPKDKNHGFVLEVIPYQETLKFSPVVIAGNRGPFTEDGNEQTQEIYGLLYEQTIKSACDTPFCQERGFPKGQEIHAETGLFLHLKNDNGGFEIARLSTIPHGNSLLALGTSSQTDHPGNFIPDVSSLPQIPVVSDISHGLSNLILESYNQIYTKPEFPEFNTQNPNQFLRDTIEKKKQVIKKMTTLNLSTGNATGGILNIPFIQHNINTTRLDAIFWIEELESGSLQLQYSQTINLVFPATGSIIPLVWPHITVNTLTKTS